MRECSQPAVGASIGKNSRTRHSQRARGDPWTFDSAISYGGVSLSIIGGGLGVLGAFLGVAGLLALAPRSLPRLESVSISAPVLLFAFLLATAVAAGLGAFTAIRATSGNLREGLEEGGRAQSGSAGSQRIGRVIVAAQIAITLVLVVGAGLLGRSLMKVLEVNPGFRVDKIITMDVSLPWVEGKSKSKGGSGDLLL